MHRTRIERIHHLAIAVPSLEGALDLWRDALGVSPDIREFPELQMREAAFPIGELEVRLWQDAGNAGDGPGLRQIGLQVTRFDDAVAACCVGPALELLEARYEVAGVPPVRLTRGLTRTPKRQASAPPTRGAKPPLPPAAPQTVKTARAPRPPVRPRGKVSRGEKKK